MALQLRLRHVRSGTNSNSLCVFDVSPTHRKSSKSIDATSLDEQGLCVHVQKCTPTDDRKEMSQMETLTLHLH